MGKKHQPPESRVTRVQNLRRSGAAGPHGNPATRRKRKRGPARQAAITTEQRDNGGQQ